MDLELQDGVNKNERSTKLPVNLCSSLLLFRTKLRCMRCSDRPGNSLQEATVQFNCAPGLRLVAWGRWPQTTQTIIFGKHLIKQQDPKCRALKRWWTAQILGMGDVELWFNLLQTAYKFRSEIIFHILMKQKGIQFKLKLKEGWEVNMTFWFGNVSGDRKKV